MRTLLVATRWLLKGIASAFVVCCVWLIYELSWRPRYDSDHPDYAYIIDQLRQASGLLNGPKDPKLVVIFDVQDLNNGGWKTACLFGGYQSPVQEMRKRRATISNRDVARFAESSQRGFRLSDVEEFEAVLSYADGQGNAHFIHFPEGLGSFGQHFRACATKPQQVIRIW